MNAHKHVPASMHTYTRYRGAPQCGRSRLERYRLVVIPRPLPPAPACAGCVCVCVCGCVCVCVGVLEGADATARDKLTHTHRNPCYCFRGSQPRTAAHSAVTGSYSPDVHLVCISGIPSLLSCAGLRLARRWVVVGSSLAPFFLYPFLPNAGAVEKKRIQNHFLHLRPCGKF
jgi:hypothetical protein